MWSGCTAGDVTVALDLPSLSPEAGVIVSDKQSVHYEMPIKAMSRFSLHSRSVLINTGVYGMHA